jgi:gliding motility-associated-like protein
MAYEYSFNGGYTWTTNNVLENLAYDHFYYIAVRNSNGCESYMLSIYIEANPVAQVPAIDIKQPSCKNPKGSMSILSIGYQYSFDNGLTWSFSNNSGPLPGGIYMVKIRTAQQCESPAIEVTINDAIVIPNIPGVTVTNLTCTVATGSITINTTAPFYSFDNGVTWLTVNTKDNLTPGTYYVKIRNDEDGCGSPPVEAVISSEGGPAPLPEVTDIQYCMGAVPATLTALGVNLLWYDNPADMSGSLTAPVPSTATFTTTTYYVTQTINGCESGRAIINVTIVPVPQAPVTQNLEYCQGDATTALTATGDNLLWYTEPTGGLSFTTVPVPSSQLPGTYIYYVSQSLNGCESERANVNVKINLIPDVPETTAILTYEQFTETQALVASGINLRWYDEELNRLWATPIPSSASIGSTTYYVSQIDNDCEGPLAKVTVIITPNYIDIDYPKFFSPNEDGMRDTWNILILDKGVKAIVEIYDRYGKIITVLQAPGAGWDGTFNGRPLPATDYWFQVRYTEFGIDKELKSHFSLIR